MPVNKWLVGILLLLLGALIYQYAQRAATRFWPGVRVPDPRGELLDVEKAMIGVYRESALSVVSIAGLGVDLEDGESFNQPPTSRGSGIIWDDEGHIVTNNHVLKQSEAAVVVLPDRTAFKGRVIGRAPELDLAVVKIDAPAERLEPVKVGTSDDLHIGQQVIAIGNPSGLTGTMTTGIISGLGRWIANSPETEIPEGSPRGIPGMIQTDASINPGNSGGPLLDSSGRMIGMTSHILPLRGTSGAGLAIPIDLVSAVVPLLISKGDSARAGLGFVPHDPREVALLFERGDLPQQGVLVREILPGSGAAEAGLRASEWTSLTQWSPGDLIVAVGSSTVTSPKELAESLADFEAGDKVPVTLIRDGETVNLEVELKVVPFVYIL